MSRSDAVRQAALDRDGFRCQICGADGRDESRRSILQVHHVDPLGMGGSDELDTEENAITLCLDCHAQVHAGSVKIVRWLPDVLECVDIEMRKIDHTRLWFYRKRAAAALEPIEARIAGLHMIDGDVARDVYTLASDDAWKALDTDSRTFREYAASRAWDAGKAVRLAALWAKGVEHGVEWEPGMTEADFRARLRAVVGGEERAFLYFRTDIETLRKLLRDGKARFVRCTDDYAASEVSVGLKVGKMFGLRSQDGCLMDLEGVVIPAESVQHTTRSASMTRSML